MRVRLELCKIDLTPPLPSNFIYLIFPRRNSALCFGVEFLCRFNLIYVSKRKKVNYAKLKISSVNCVAAYWEIAAHSAYDMFSMYSYLIVNIVFSSLGIWNLNFFLIAPIPDHCLLVPFYLKGSECLLPWDVSLWTQGAWVTRLTKRIT